MKVSAPKDTEAERKLMLLIIKFRL